MLSMECLKGGIFAELGKNYAASWFDGFCYHVLLFNVNLKHLQDKDNWSSIKINWIYTKWIGQEMKERLLSHGKSSILMILCVSLVYLYVNWVEHTLWREGL